MSRVRKVYNLRKTTTIKMAGEQQDIKAVDIKEEQVNRTNEIDKNISVLSHQIKEVKQQIEEVDHYQVEGEELVVDKLQLSFQANLNDIDRKEIKVKNIGNSAVFVQWIFKNNSKINSNAIKDSKPKFFCHYDTNVIKPSQEITFIFTFLSQFSGYFTEEVELSCQPPLQTKIPLLKFTGKANIADEWKKGRSQFIYNLHNAILLQEVREILNDMVDQVKLPEPPRPDVKNPEIAQKLFQERNSHLNLYYNQYLHNWFNELFDEINAKGGIPVEQRYWNQSVETMREMIIGAKYLDDVQMKCYLDRLEHYCYLSQNPLPNKSQLYPTIYQFISSAAYKLGGDFIDSVRKQLDMWQIPFRQPLESDTPEQLKARKEEIEKIKAQWVKRSKKKKWGQQQERQMVNEFKKKVQHKVNESILDRFSDFQNGAEYIRVHGKLSKSNFDLKNYHQYLERIKTVKQYPLQGKKVIIKANLKLKQNCEEKLKQLENYLFQKKQEQKRLEQQKKNNQNNPKKKKAPAKPKKKGQKEQEEQKPLFFDFMSILDEENWNGFLETFRIVSEKQPFLILIAFAYGPRSGRVIPEYSIKFLLEHLKSIESSIEFLPHQHLLDLQERLQNQSISEGSILLMENVNFLPFETTVQQIQHVEEGKISSFSKRKLLHCQIRQFFDRLGQSVDVLINQDMFLQQQSGFSAYLNKEVVLGSYWWKYVGYSTRVANSTVIFGEDFTPSNYILLYYLLRSVRKIYLTGRIGLKFYLIQHGFDSFGDVIITKQQKNQINLFLEDIKKHSLEQKIQVPQDFIAVTENEGQKILYTKDKHEQLKHHKIIDIGSNSIQHITNISKGTVFFMGETSIKLTNSHISDSLQIILKNIFKKQELKRQRHQKEGNNINYLQDLVVFLVGFSDDKIEEIDLKDKKIKSEEQGEENGEQEEQNNQKRKIDLIADFKLMNTNCLKKLWSGVFDIGLSNVGKYAVVKDD